MLSGQCLSPLTGQRQEFGVRELQIRELRAWGGRLEWVWTGRCQTQLASTKATVGPLIILLVSSEHTAGEAEVGHDEEPQRWAPFPRRQKVLDTLSSGRRAVPAQHTSSRAEYPQLSQVDPSQERGLRRRNPFFRGFSVLCFYRRERLSPDCLLLFKTRIFEKQGPHMKTGQIWKTSPKRIKKVPPTTTYKADFEKVSRGNVSEILVFPRCLGGGHPEGGTVQVGRGSRGGGGESGRGRESRGGGGGAAGEVGEGLGA